MRAENPWWNDGRISADYAAMKRRAYFELLRTLVEVTGIRRAVIVMGLRRVGKTVLLHHLIAQLLGSKRYEPREIAYVSLNQPVFTGLSIDEVAQDLCRASRSVQLPRMLFLDEIQYLADWERHLKAFVDAHPEIRCVACGSAAAALRLKNVESGAGRFTDFNLPPLTFYEYFHLRNEPGLIELPPDGPARVKQGEVAELNRHFVDYVNFGGFPEAALSSAVQADHGRFIDMDIAERVLLSDLPSLYGIQDIRALNALLTTLANGTAGELSLEDLSRSSDVAKPTLRRYLEYLEAAFLIKVVHRIDDNARRFRRATRFKVYLTTPSLHGALLGPTEAGDKAMDGLAETAVFTQWFQSNLDLHYARWPAGEVDLVHLDKKQVPRWCLKVTWSDRAETKPDQLAGLARFAARHPGAKALVTTKTLPDRSVLRWPGPGELHAIPTSVHCYLVGRAALGNPSPAPIWWATD